MRQEGKAESAMNALKSMMKASARVRRDGAEAEIPAEQVVVGDVVLITAGDEVPADGRIIVASSLQIDESALTGESVPAAKEVAALVGQPTRAGRSGEHGVHEYAGHARQRHDDRDRHRGRARSWDRISGMLAATGAEQSPLTREMNRLTLWIAAAAGLTMVVMFALGRSRGQAWDALFTAAVALAIAAIPEALPTVAQTILSLGGVELAKRNAIVKDLPSVETLGFTSAINSDKTGTLTMNQMTAVEVVGPADRYTVSGTGYSLEGRSSTPRAGRTRPKRRSCPTSWQATPSWWTARWSVIPPRAPCWYLVTRPTWTSRRPGTGFPGWPPSPLTPRYKLMATFHTATDTAWAI